MKNLFNNDYIHSQNSTESVQNSITAQSNQSISGDKITTLPMNQNVEFKEHIFGIDRMICSVPIYDMSTGEVVIDIKKLKKKLKSFSFIQSQFKNDMKEKSFETFDYFLEDDYDIDLEEVQSYEKIVGTLNMLPVKIIVKNDILTIDLTLSSIFHGNNSNPTEISDIEHLSKVVSQHIGVDILGAYLNQVEFTFGIKTNQSISNLLDSLGNLGNSDRHSSPWGIRWTGIGHSSSLQVYSTNVKNKLKVAQGVSTRSSELKELEKLGYDMIRVENRHRYGFKPEMLSTLHSVSDLIDPEFIVEELNLFKTLFSKVIKNESKLCIKELENVDIDDLVLNIVDPTDCKNLLMAIGWTFAQDIFRNNLTNINMRNKKRLKQVFDMCQSYMLDMIHNNSIPQHFQNTVMEVIQHYIQLFEGMKTKQGSIPNKGPLDNMFENFLIIDSNN